jgi:hypothetical protein
VKASSTGLRERVVSGVEEGHSWEGMVHRFGATHMTIKQYTKQLQGTENLVPKPLPGLQTVKEEALRAGL